MGNLAVGKTTLSEKLHESLPASVLVKEELENPHLKPFYDHLAHSGNAYNPHAFPLQKYFFEKRLENEEKSQSSCGVVISDRFLNEYFAIFVKNARNKGFVSAQEFAELQGMYGSAPIEALLPDVVYYLKASEDACALRIEARNRLLESKAIDREYLRELNRLYDNFLAELREDRTRVEIVELDTTTLSAEQVFAEVFSHCLKALKDAS